MRRGVRDDYRGRVAQSVEHSPANQEVPGSIPVSANSAYE